ncbi:hypothetical protein [Stenotrophomonas sp. MMGLT7]|uniref:hypothetical protein n=1 Tax=Stenotrophomonas sp. MMGLT7 TaxID=2901227 RepID=UPI001E528216|nr:hypothetical protein [Stenotrophomonas sp. MMGLT7]MCD7098101.1 hypothetical protein [Stenotrophomonas sp. MMGLT7]
MSASLLSALIYVLGFVGLVAIGVLPLRAWQVLRSTRGEKWALVLVALIAAVALWNEVRITARIFRCLTEIYCGPSIASGWTYLAVLGVVYLSFEVTVCVLKKIVRAKTNTQSKRIELK